MHTYFTTAYLAQQMDMSQVQVQRLIREGKIKADVQLVGIGHQVPMRGFRQKTVEKLAKERKE